MKNIFSLTGKVDENYLSRVLCYVFECDKEFCGYFIENVFGLKNFGPVKRITPEKHFDEGRPDIEIKSESNNILAIENKIGAGFQAEQIERYIRKYGDNVFVIYKNLSNVDQALTAKKVLSRHEVNYEVCCYLNRLPKGYDEIKKFVLNEFTIFLEEMGMAIKRVSYEIVNGVDSLLNLCSQMDEALNRARLENKLKNYKMEPGSRDYTGWKITEDDPVYMYLYYSPFRFVSSFWSRKDHKKNNYKKLNEVLPGLGGDNDWYLSTLDIRENNYLCSDIDVQIQFLEQFVSDTLSVYKGAQPSSG
jgi:hypothetical protein